VQPPTVNELKGFVAAFRLAPENLTNDAAPASAFTVMVPTTGAVIDVAIRVRATAPTETPLVRYFERSEAVGEPGSEQVREPAAATAIAAKLLTLVPIRAVTGTRQPVALAGILKLIWSSATQQPARP